MQYFEQRRDPLDVHKSHALELIQRAAMLHLPDFVVLFSYFSVQFYFQFSSFHRQLHTLSPCNRDTAHGSSDTTIAITTPYTMPIRNCDPLRLLSATQTWLLLPRPEKLRTRIEFVDISRTLSILFQRETL